MGFFQSLKEDLSSSVNDMINADGIAEEGAIQEEVTFLDGEPLLSDEMLGDDKELEESDFSSASYEQNIDDLLNTLKTISEENETDNSVDQLLESIEEPLESLNSEQLDSEQLNSEQVVSEEEAYQEDISGDTVQEGASEDIFSVRDALNSLKHASRKRDEQRELMEEDVREATETEEVSLDLESLNISDAAATAEEPEQLEFDFDSVLKASISEEQNADTDELSDKIVAMAISEIEEAKEEDIIADEDIAVPISPAPVSASIEEDVVKMVSVDDMPSVEASSNEGLSEAAALEESDPILSELLKEYQDKLGSEEEVKVEEPASPVTMDIPVETVLQEEDEIQPVDATPVDSDLIMDEDEVSNDTAVITSGMSISGDINSNGNLDILGSIKGNITIKGKLNVAGSIDGDSVANEIFVDGAEINGNVSANGSVKVGAGSVIIGDIKGRGAVIAGAVKGEIDVQGPVILDSSAIVMGNIKSMTVQINNGAVIEGMCSQCYAPVNPVSFFDELKKAEK